MCFCMYCYKLEERIQYEYLELKSLIGYLCKETIEIGEHILIIIIINFLVSEKPEQYFSILFSIHLPFSFSN